MSDDLGSLFAQGLTPENAQLGIEQDDQAPFDPLLRAYDAAFDDTDSLPISITLIKIDAILLAHIRQKLKPQVEHAGRSVIVPIEYANAERWKQVRKDGVMRDAAGRLQTPLIVFRHTSIGRNTMTSPVNKYLWRSYQTGWNRHNSYDKFAVLNHISPSRKRVEVRIPDYVDLKYSFMIWTDYVEQMNELIEQFNFEMDNYWGVRGDFKFKVTVDSYSTETDVDCVSDRIVKTTFEASVKAYLLPETYIHTDQGVQTTGQNRHTYKKVVTFLEVEASGRKDSDPRNGEI